MVVSLSVLKGMDQAAVGKLNSAGISDIQDILGISPSEMEVLSESLEIAISELRIIAATARMLFSAWAIIERHMEYKSVQSEAPEPEGAAIDPGLLGLYPSRIVVDSGGQREAEVRDTGFTVSQVLHQLSTGREIRDLLEVWTDLEYEDLQACLSYASLVLSKPAGAA